MAAYLYPGEDFARVYRVLEDITQDPRAIKTTTDGPSLGLVVDDWVYDEFLARESPEPKKKAGRPKKNPEPVTDQES